MAREVVRLMFALAMMAIVTDVSRRDVVRAWEGDCTCGFYNGGGVFIYQDDNTYVDEAQGLWTYSISPYDYPGSYQCAYLCYNYGRAIGNNLCSTYGSGHKYNMVGWWNYDDNQNLNGGSAYGWFDSYALYEC